MASSNSRRRLNTSSESSGGPLSPELEQALVDSLRHLNLLDSTSDADTNPDPVPIAHLTTTDRELNRMLSLHSEISTTSATAERHATAQKRDKESFSKIGAGACGAIFAQDGHSMVVKLSKTDDHDFLWNDYVMHKRIEEQFNKYHINEIQVPECYYYVPVNHTAYFEEHPSLVEVADKVCRFPTNALVSERILPLPKPTRNFLIEKYCAPRNKAAALSDSANDDCLVRLYLGSSHGKRSGMFFSLRNFKLHLNQMLEIHLDVEEIARRMAIAMAIMHWGAKTDARDIEFVLGSSSKKASLAVPSKALDKLEPHTYTGPRSHNTEDFFRRITHLWVLDFNQVRPITMDAAGVAQAVEAARINDPYLPKPLQESTAEKKVWNTFAVSYIKTANVVLKDGGHGDQELALPRMFLRGIIDTQKQKQQAEEARKTLGEP